MTPVDLAEMIFQTRCAISECGRKVPLAKDSMMRLEIQLVAEARALGLDPGKTAEDADSLKLKLMGHPAADESRDPPDEEPEKEGATKDRVLSCLEEAVRVSGCECTPHRVVGRWSEFVSRAIFGLQEDGTSLVRDDPEIPVGKWVRDHAVDTGDLGALAEAYLAWTKEVCQKFEAKTFGAR